MTPPRLLLRRIGLFLLPVVPGVALLIYLAGQTPLPPAASADVRTVDLESNPTIAVENLGTSSSVGTSRSATISDGIQNLTLTDAAGAEVTRPFRAWVLRSRSLEPGATPTTFSVLDVRLEGARRPATLAEYEARIASPLLDVIASAEEALFLLEDRLWNEARLSGNVDVRAKDEQGRPGRLRTETLLCRLKTRHVETQDAVSVERPGFVLEGKGLRADVGLRRRIEVLHDVSLSLDMAEADLPWSTTDKDHPFRIRCDGPLLVEELGPEPGEVRRLRVTAEGNVSGSRGESSGIECDALSMLLRMIEKPEDTTNTDPRADDVEVLEIEISKLAPLVLTSTAGDRVRIEGERLDWRRRGDAAWEATVTGNPLVVLVPPDSAPEVEVRSTGPATILVEGGQGLAEAVFNDDVTVRRGAEILRGDVVTLVRRADARSLTARGHVAVDGPTIRARATELQRVERKDGSRTTTLTGTPKLIFSGAAGLDLLGGSPPPAEPKESPDDTETEVTSGGPIVLLETANGSTARASGGVIVVRRAAGTETGRLRAVAADLRLGAGEQPRVETIDARGEVNIEGMMPDDRRFFAAAGTLNYRRDGERLTLAGNRPHLRLDDHAGITTLRGERITWSRLSGEFEVTGPVEADLPVGVDLLLSDAAGTEGAGGGDPVHLRCDHLAGVLGGGESGETASLRSALATGDVELKNAAGRVSGARLLLAAEEDGFSARVSGAPARIERHLAGGHVDFLEGPELLAGAGAEGEMRTLLAPKGARGTLHLLPREGASGAMTRIDLNCAGAVTVGQTSLDAPGGVKAEHRTWSKKLGEWGEPLKLSGKRMTGTFASAGATKARQVKAVELRDDVRVEPPGGGLLTCTWARILPAEDTVEFGGTPDIVWKSARGKVRRATSARYCYRPDLRDGTRLRLVIPRRGGR